MCESSEFGANQEGGEIPKIRNFCPKSWGKLGLSKSGRITSMRMVRKLLKGLASNESKLDTFEYGLMEETKKMNDSSFWNVQNVLPSCSH